MENWYKYNIDKTLVVNIVSKMQSIEKKQYVEHIISFEHVYFELINLLFGICAELGISQSTVFLTIYLVYHILYYVNIQDTMANSINIERLLMLGITCVIIAIKIDSINEISVNMETCKKIYEVVKKNTYFNKHIDFSNNYSDKFIDYQVTITEHYVIHNLDYNLLLVTPMTFVDIYVSEIIHRDNVQHNKEQILQRVISLLIAGELLPNYFPTNTLPSKKCAAAIAESRNYIYKENNIIFNIWPKYAIAITGYKIEELIDTCHSMTRALRKSQQIHNM